MQPFKVFPKAASAAESPCVTVLALAAKPDALRRAPLDTQPRTIPLCLTPDGGAASFIPNPCFSPHRQQFRRCDTGALVMGGALICYRYGN